MDSSTNPSLNQVEESVYTDAVPSSCDGIREPRQRLLGIKYYEICVTWKSKLASYFREIIDSPEEERLAIRRSEKYILQAAARELLPRERVAMCMRVRINPHESVKLMYSEKIKRAHYKNLIVCGSVWQCPVCSQKIAIRRRDEVRFAIEHGGENCALLSLTLSHKSENLLDETVSILNDSFRAIKSGKNWKSLEEQYGIIGSIASFDITFGKNGFHPHKHALIFFKDFVPSKELRKIKTIISRLWRREVAKRGGYASGRIAVSLKHCVNDDQELYISKWGLENEISLNHLKASDGGFTMVDLLRLYLRGEEIAGEIWKSYAESMKGKRQLVWSRGLKDSFGIGEVSDQELAEREDKEARLLARIDLGTWQIICKKELRGKLLEVASGGDEMAVEEWLRGLHER